MADIPPPPPGFKLLAEPQAPAVPPPPPGFKPIEPAPGSLDDPNMKLPPLTPAKPGAGEGGLTVNMTNKPPEPTLVDRIMGGVDTAGGIGAQALVGARKGVSAIAGLPVDLASLITNGGTWLINKGLEASGVTEKRIPYATNPVGGSGTVDQLFAAPARAVQAATGAPQQDPAPRNMPERLTRRVGEEVGAMSVPVVGAIGKAARVGVEGARELNPLARMFVEPAAVDAGKFAAKETKAAVAAGTGAGLVNEVTGKAQNDAAGKESTTGQKLGDLGGAVGGVGVTGLAGAIARPVGTAIGSMTGRPQMADTVIRDVATDEIARAAGVAPNARGVIDTGPLASTIENGRRVDEVVPGFVESTADRSKNPGLAAMEYGRQSGPNTGQYTARRDANTDAVDKALAKSEPQGTPGALRGELETQRDVRLNQAADARATAEDAATAAVQPITPQGTPAARGNTVRTELEAARDTTRQATEEAYERAGINDNPLAPTYLAEALDRVTAGLARADRVDTPQGLIDQIAQVPPGTEMTVREATALKTRLLGMQEKAVAEPGGRNAARVLGQYLDAVEEVIQGSITAEQRTALRDARGARRAEGDAFERKGDPVADILAVRPGGTPRMRDENVAALSVRNDAMGRILQQADTPATREAIRNQVLSNADTSSAAGLYDFQQRFAEQLQRFPGLVDEIGAAIQARVSENTARGAEGGLLKEIGKDGRGTVAKYLQYGDENAQKAMQGVLSNKDPARAADELLTFVGDDPKAVEGARKVFWDIMQKQARRDGESTSTIGGVQPWMPRALKKFVDDPAKGAVAERLYRDNPEHWANVKQIAEAIQGVDVRNGAKAPNTSGTPQGLQGGFLPTGETLASRIFAVERGVVSPAFAALNIVGIMARKATKNAQIGAVNQAIDKALLDPDWAAALLKENNPANRAALARSAKGWMGNEASNLIELLNPDEPDGETKRAVMRSDK